MQKTILLFGAGKSATILIEYLISEAATNNWRILIADVNKKQIESVITHSTFAEAVEIDVTNNEQRSSLIKQADIVISLMPPALHFLIAKDCVTYNKNLLTASYIDEQIKSLQPEIEKKGLLFLCEMGLDPGIDHMSAMQLIDSIKAKGGTIISFKSHCGGLVAPESDDNPWHYKISWNPRNVVMAGKSGAIYKTDGNIVKENYEELFDVDRGIKISDLDNLSYYPNRDSLSYINLYHLETAETFIRTTLRHYEFMYGWKNLIELKLTDETIQYETDGLSLCNFFKAHLSNNGFGEWLKVKLVDRMDETKELLDNLIKLMDTENEAKNEGQKIPENIMLVDEEGDLRNLEVDDVKNKVTSVLANQMHVANITLKQLFYLGMDDEKTIINKGKCSVADVLQFIIEKKLPLQPADKDMVVMVHEITYKDANNIYNLQSSMIIKGENNLKTAMAKTVGLPLGIVVKLILNNSIQLSGLHIPVVKEIYEPVLKELKNFGISFKETVETIN